LLCLEKRKERKTSKGNQALIIGNPSQDLPYAEKEARSIGKVFNHLPLIGPQLNLSEIIKGMRNARWVHFACHGDAEEKAHPLSIYTGGLLMAPEMMAPKRPPIYLYSEEIQKQKMEAELVFLSACSSGRGIVQREGLINLPRAFLLAGADSVIATHWQIPDEDTFQIVSNFYTLLQGQEKKDKPVLLRKAILEFLKDPKMRDQPHRWGAFFFTGIPY